MNVNKFEQGVSQAAGEWSFVRFVETVEKTDHAVKLRLHIDTDCFVQVYANVRKALYSYTLVLNRSRIYGRDREGGTWHRHPYGNPGDHDHTPDAQAEVSLSDFLAEVQEILQAVGLL